MINPKRPPYIELKDWIKMSWKEKDYIQLLSERRRTKDEIKRILYITTDA